MKVQLLVDWKKYEIGDTFRPNDELAEKLIREGIAKEAPEVIERASEPVEVVKEPRKPKIKK